MSDFWAELGRVLLLDVPYNTSLVLRSVAVLGAACGIIGVFLLLRKRSLVADALAHATLPGVCAGFLIALAFGADARSLHILLPAAAVVGAIGVACIHALNTLPRVREDASIGIVLSVFFAIGIVLLGLIQTMPVSQKAGLHHFIFGQAATMSANDSRLILFVASVILLASVACFKELRVLCFDPEYARSIGFSRGILDGLLMSLVTILTVIGLHAVGALLMVALLIIPAVAARFWTDRLGAMVLIAATLGAGGAYIGAAASAIGERVPTGPAIVIACGALFVFSILLAPKRGLLIEMIHRWSLRATIARQHFLRAMYERGEIAGNSNAPVTSADLHERRSWSGPRLKRLLRGAIRRGDIIEADGGHVLTPRGREHAARIVRTHRLWEHYLTTQADIAPSHVDRAVEDIEHVLGEEIVAELERELGEQWAPATDRSPTADIVPSAHALKEEHGTSREALTSDVSLHVATKREQSA